MKDAAYHRAWRAKHRERLNEQARIRRASNAENCRKYQREWARQNRGRQAEYQRSPLGRLGKRKTRLKAKYGLTLEQFDQMLQNQKNCCYTCCRPFRSTKHRHVDHDHQTGRVRGILCSDCNRALGAVRDDVEVLRALIAYLETT